MNAMVFEYKKWDEFCVKLRQVGLISIPACAVAEAIGRYIVLKHDVETNVPRAVELAKIEQKYGHHSSYYVQAYLLKSHHNVDMLKRMQEMGHEISYHYDVMDSNKGNLENAIVEFEKNRQLFESYGFHTITVCQHGNPVVERNGYTSNRDFFRSNKVQDVYPDIADIMVDFKEKYHTDYIYYSDVGRKFSMIYDPINNDRINSDDKNIKYENLNDVLNAIITRKENVILSTHPHRWTKSAVEYVVRNGLFQVVKSNAKLLLHVPGMKRLMGRYYYLAKKF